MDTDLVRRSGWRVAAIVVVAASVVGGLYSVTTVRNRIATVAAASPTATVQAPEPVGQGSTVPPQPGAVPSDGWAAEPPPPPPVPTTAISHVPTLDELADGDYLVDRLSANGGEQAYPGGGVPLTFIKDERGVRMRTGSCDLVAGYVDVDGERLVVTGGAAAGLLPASLSRTATSCQGDVLRADDVLLALLSSRPTVAVVDDQLIVIGDDMSLRAHRRAG